MAERPAKGGLRRRHGAVMLLMGLLAVPTAAEAPHHRGPQESGACHVEQTRSEIAPTQLHSHSKLYEHLDFEILSERPRMYYFPRFLSDEPCDRIRELGLPHLKPSQTDAGLAKKVRSSTSYFFSQEQERASPDRRQGDNYEEARLFVLEYSPVRK